MASICDVNRTENIRQYDDQSASLSQDELAPPTAHSQPYLDHSRSRDTDAFKRAHHVRSEPQLRKVRCYGSQSVLATPPKGGGAVGRVAGLGLDDYSVHLGHRPERERAELNEQV